MKYTNDKLLLTKNDDIVEEKKDNIIKKKKKNIIPSFMLMKRLRGGDETSTDNNLVKELLAEFIGTFLIVFLGTGSVMSAIYTNSLIGLFQIASVWIIAVTVAIYTTSSISGAHLNPAISIAFAFIRPSNQFNYKKIVPYSVFQLLGAMFGSYINYILYSSTITTFETTNNIIRSTSIESAKAFGEYFISPISTKIAFIAEAIGTAILSFVIFALTNTKNDATKDNGSIIPPIIGCTVGGLIAVIAPLTQAGFNPARDFGPRIIAFLFGWKNIAFQNAWLYIVAPIVGAIIGAYIADNVLYK